MKWKIANLQFLFRPCNDRVKGQSSYATFRKFWPDQNNVPTKMIAKRASTFAAIISTMGKMIIRESLQVSVAETTAVDVFRFRVLAD